MSEPDTLDLTEEPSGFPFTRDHIVAERDRLEFEFATAPQGSWEEFLDVKRRHGSDLQRAAVAGFEKEVLSDLQFHQRLYATLERRSVDVLAGLYKLALSDDTPIAQRVKAMQEFLKHGMPKDTRKPASVPIDTPKTLGDGNVQTLTSQMADQILELEKRGMTVDVEQLLGLLGRRAPPQDPGHNGGDQPPGVQEERGG